MFLKIYNHNNKKTSSEGDSKRGFTLVEITICVVVIAILATITTVVMSGVIFNSRDSQRSSKVTVLAEALEKYYQQYGEYPTCEKLSQPPSVVVSTTLKGLDSGALTAPNAPKGTNSISCNTGSKNNFIYTLTDTGAYTIAYSKEQDGASVVVNSRYNGALLLGNVNLNISIESSTHIRLYWSSVQDASNYRVQKSTDGTFQTGVTENVVNGLDYDDSSLSSGVRYYYRVMAHRVNAYGNWANVNGVTPISTPSTPVVATSTSGDSTTWSWPAVSCSAGTVNYQYRYVINNGYDSGWKAPSSIPITQTTNYEGFTYTVSVQARCSTAYTSSSWSGAGSASYYKPYSLTLVAGTGGTVSGAGNYNGGSSVTITATPNSGYVFNSWTGSTGCSGTASHTIVMDGTKACTANFALNTYNLALSAGTGGTVSGANAYTSGSSATITATPNSGYSFYYWTGSDGCSGAASHSITMNIAKTCTAYFAVNRSTTVALSSTSNQAQSTTASLSNLALIRSVTTDNGYVSSYSQSGNNVTVNVNGGATSTGTTSGAWDPYLYSKYSTTTYGTVSSCGSLPSYITETLADGYSGTLYHVGTSCAVAGTSTSAVYNPQKEKKILTNWVNWQVGSIAAQPVPPWNYSDSEEYSGLIYFSGYDTSNITGYHSYGTGDYYYCVGEGQTCYASRHIYAMYGTGGLWAGNDNHYGSINCDNATFGVDPAPNQVKYCKISREEGHYDDPPGTPIYNAMYSGTVYKSGYDMVTTSTYQGTYSGTLYHGGYPVTTYTYYPYTITINYATTN